MEELIMTTMEISTMQPTVNNKRKLFGLAILILFNIVACKPHFNNQISNIKGNFMGNTEINNKLMMSNEQVSLFKTIEYFSTEYPYTVTKVQEFFNTDLILEENNDVTYLYSSKSNDMSNLKSIYIKGYEEKGQSLKLDFKTPICFNTDMFAKKMVDDDYSLLLIPPVPSYAKIMDEERNTGTLQLEYTLINNKNDICILGLNFNSRILFDRSRFINE